MSIYGEQFLFPLFIRKNSVLPSISDNGEITLAFYLLTKDLKPDEKILSFSRLLWPLLSIQGDISTHIILDGLNVFSKQGKFCNPPRQPLIGHILRNIDNRTEIEVLNKIMEILTYKDKDAEEIGTGEESEYQTQNIKGLINPEYLQAFFKLIPQLEYLPITKYVPLDQSISTEEALDISEEYRNMIKAMKGNSYRWKTQIKLIGEVIEKWMGGLTAKLKDVDYQFSSQINKTSGLIDDVQMKREIELEHDKIDQWKVNEKKNLIVNISVLFKTAERNLQDIVKRIKFFTTEDILKTKVFEDLLPSFDKNFSYLKEQGNKFLETVESLYQKYNILKEEAVRIEAEGTNQLEEFKKSSNLQLQNRDKQISEYEVKKQEEMQTLSKLKNEIEKLLKNVEKILQNKEHDCLQDAQDLINWSLEDTQEDLFAKPIQWIYMPLYVLFIEDEDLMEERMNIVLPGYIGDGDSLYEEIDDSFVQLKSALNERIEEDMKVRSNFEFSSERKNLIKDPTIKQKIQSGIKDLRKKSLLNEAMETKIKETLNLF